MAERETPKGNLQKLSQQDAIDFCFQSMGHCHGGDGRTLAQRVEDEDDDSILASRELITSEVSDTGNSAFRTPNK
ncbi:hypothetical protein HPB48_002987 [Haemaphysalis longicornis]|uniref:Uncharacterized protein n=1 Tax=Haemaphysalis longicornis TaxID=44386 RepID=A0A9J6FDX6_HAELO|nr:hypothetical protein HPB48_002987 [Haemaphysalis longicornis]